LFDTDDIELSQLCEKMDTENNLINTADIFDIFNLFDTAGGLKDLELTIFSQSCDNSMSSVSNKLKMSNSELAAAISSGTAALMVLGQFSDICE
jgi:hypothetical protein